MTSIGLIELIPSWMLISAGLILIAIEIFAGLFILLWFGIGLVIVGFLSFFVDFGHGEIQIIFAFAIGTVLMFALRRKVMAPHNAEKEAISTHQPGETGRLSMHNNQWMVYYHGTHWLVANPSDDLKEGQQVKVTEIKHNQAWIEPETIIET